MVAAGREGLQGTVPPTAPASAGLYQFLCRQHLGKGQVCLAHEQVVARWWLWWDGLSLLQLGSLYPQDLAQAQPPPSWSQALPSVLASRFGEQCQLRAG